MKSGIDLIAQEREEQINKHGRTIVSDVRAHSPGDLTKAAMALLNQKRLPKTNGFPLNWDKEICLKMAIKPYKERLVIAAALIAAEIDRLQHEENITKG